MNYYLCPRHTKEDMVPVAVFHAVTVETNYKKDTKALAHMSYMLSLVCYRFGKA